MKKYAIIAAGGSGTRMQSALPKQFMILNGKPVLWHSVNAFHAAFDDIDIIVVAPPEHISHAKEVCSGFSRVQFAEGGATRFLSVKNGLAFVTHPAVVFVHDAVRCLVTVQLIHHCYEQTLLHGSAVPAVPVIDSVRIVAGNVHRVVDRNEVRIIQTPQTFKSDIILPAFETADDLRFTDEATVVESGGQPVCLVEGERTNIKITTPVDLLVAQQIMQQSSTENPQ